jgi:hypothetical protein
VFVTLHLGYVSLKCCRQGQKFTLIVDPYWGTVTNVLAYYTMVLITIVKSNIVQARVPKCECWDLSVKTQQCFKYKILKVKMLDAGFNLS